MKRVVTFVCSVALAAAGSPASAQIAGMPVWNSPRGGTGLILSADLGFPDSAGGKGATYAGRVDVGLPLLGFGVTIGVRNPKGSGPNFTEYGATATFRVIGGSLAPVAVNLQGGVAGYSQASVTNTRFTAALGIAVTLPTPGVDLEPWVAPGFRVNHRGASGPLAASTNTNFGIAGGVTLGLGFVGLHAGVDYERLAGGRHTTTFGIGAHAGLRVPAGL